MSDEKPHNPEYFPPVAEDEAGLTLKRNWTDEEERKAKRK
jgi:hypothetical protein